MHCLRPASTCVEQLLASAFAEVVDGALGNAILEVGIDAAEGKLLSRVVAGLLEGIVEESSVVAVVVLDLHTVSGGEGLEGAFGCYGLFRSIVDLEVDKAQAAVVVDKDCGAPVALLGKFPFHLRKEPNFR